MRASFTKAKAPVLASVVKERTVRDAICAIRSSEYAGATAIDLHVSTLDPEFKNTESIKKILDCTKLPVLILNYNHTYEIETYDATEEERVGLLEMGAAAGASAVDIQGYTFNLDVKHNFVDTYATDDMLFAAKKPKEVALDPETVQKQIEFIDRMHAQGTEVLLSCHTQVNLNTEEALCLAKLLEKRNPDVIKLVMPCDTDEELIEQFKTMITLKKEISCPVHFHCTGAKGKVTRVVNPLLGAHLAFCIERYGINQSTDQLDLRTYSQAIELLERGL